MPKPFRFAVQAYRPESGRAWRELARSVEALGFSALHTSDHYLGPGAVSEQTGHRPVTLAPVPAMAVAAEVTTTLRIGCRLFCVGYHHPLGRPRRRQHRLLGDTTGPSGSLGWVREGAGERYDDVELEIAAFFHVTVGDRAVEAFEPEAVRDQALTVASHH